MKKKLSAALLLIILLASCTGNPGTAENDDKISIVTTTFPIYDWVREITGETDIELTLLLDSGTDLHSYEPTVSDITSIADCDMFIYAGGSSDSWIEDVLKNNTGDAVNSVSLLELIGDRVKQEEHVEGMEQDEQEHGGEPDEHVWLSLKNAGALCQSLGERLCLIDSKNADAIKSNLKEYTEKLELLDGRYEAALADNKHDTLVFCDRFPFRYLMDDYSLNYFAPFAGCSTETQASFETVAFLSSKVDELGLENVMVIETSDESIAKTVIANTADKNQGILVLNSMQSVTSDERNAGITYLSVMEENLNVLSTGLRSRF